MGIRGRRRPVKKLDGEAEGPPLDLLVTESHGDSRYFYAPTVEIHFPELGKTSKFLLDTGSMSSIISDSILTPSVKLMKTGVSIAIANEEDLDVKGVACLNIQLENIPDPQEAIFVVTSQKWKKYDGILGNDVMLRLESIINMKERKLQHKFGQTPLKMMRQQVSDLILLPMSIKPGVVQLKIDDDEKYEIEVECLPGQCVPAKSTKIIRFKATTTPEGKDACLVIPDWCLHEFGCWSPECMVTVDENDEFLMEVTNHSDLPILLSQCKTQAEIIEHRTANTLDLRSTDVAPKPKPIEESRSGRFHAIIKKIVKAAKCSKKTRQKLRSLLLCYPDVLAFKDEAIGTSKLFKQDIPLTTTKAIRVPQYPIPKKLRDPLNDWVKEMLHYGVIRPSRSPYNSPCLLVRKKTGEWRVVVDFRRLNLYLAHDPYPLPKINELLTSLGRIGKSTFFSALDLLWGFFHIELQESDKQKTAFTTPMGRFEYNRMPMGMKTAPAAFQRLVDLAILQSAPYPTACYIDDILLATNGEEAHLKHLEWLLDRLRNTGLKLKVDKCEFFQTDVAFLGHKLTRDGIQVCHDKVQKVQDFPQPTSVDGVRSFLGLASYYRKFIKNYAKIAKPLTTLLQSKVGFKWTKKQEEAFHELKESLVTAPVLAYPQDNQPYIITVGYTDSSISAILSQKQDGAEKPLNFASRVLHGAELNYLKKHGPEELEMLAITYALRQFFTEIYNNKVTVRGQEKVIDALSKTTTKATSQRQAKWIDTIRMFPELTFEIVKDTKVRPAMELAKAEQRRANKEEKDQILVNAAEIFNAEDKEKPHETVPEEEIETDPEESLYISPSFNHQEYTPILIADYWKDLQSRDPYTQSTIKKLKDGQTDDFKLKDGLLYRIRNNAERLVIPFLGREHLMYMFHSPPRRGHYDGKRTYEAAKPYAYWPNMQRDVISFCRHCSKCQFYNKRTGKPGPYPRGLPDKPWQAVSADIAGPFPASARGYRYILVMQDQLTRTIKLACLKHATADEVTRHFIDRILREEGTPETILTDRGTHFTAYLFRGICAHLGVSHTTTTAYRPQCNGANERSHKELNRFLSIYSDKTRPQDWDLLVKEAEWAHNTTYHSSLRRSPYEAQRAFPPPLHGLGSALRKEHPAMKKALEDTSFEMPDEVVIQKYFTLLDAAIIKTRDEIYDHLNRVQEGHRQLLKKQKKKYLNLDIGDKVLLEQPGTAIKGSAKKYTGPYIVKLQRSPAVYVIEEPITKKWQTVNQARLKPYKLPNRLDDAVEMDPILTREEKPQPTTKPAPPPILDDDDDDDVSSVPDTAPAAAAPAVQQRPRRPAFARATKAISQLVNRFTSRRK